MNRMSTGSLSSTRFASLSCFFFFRARLLASLAEFFLRPRREPVCPLPIDVADGMSVNVFQDCEDIVCNNLCHLSVYNFPACYSTG